MAGGTHNLGTSTTAAPVVDGVVVVVVVVVGPRDVVRIARQGNHVNERVVPVDVGPAEKVPAPNEAAHLIVKVEIDPGHRREAGAAQGFGALVDDRSLVDDLGGTGAGRGQLLVELAPVEVVQGPGGNGTAEAGTLAVSGAGNRAEWGLKKNGRSSWWRLRMGRWSGHGRAINQR